MKRRMVVWIENPIGFTSRTLSDTQKKLEKEALAIVFSVKRFHPGAEIPPKKFAH